VEVVAAVEVVVVEVVAAVEVAVAEVVGAVEVVDVAWEGKEAWEVVEE